MIQQAENSIQSLVQDFNVMIANRVVDVLGKHRLSRGTLGIVCLPSLGHLIAAEDRNQRLRDRQSDGLSQVRFHQLRGKVVLLSNMVAMAIDARLSGRFGRMANRTGTLCSAVGIRGGFRLRQPGSLRLSHRH